MTKIITTLSMRPENLQRHLNYNPHIITTGRDEIKGLPEDVFRIEGDDRIWVLEHVTTRGYTIDVYAELYYKQEGFLTDSEYKGSAPRAIAALKHTLRKIYGDYDHVRIYPHVFHATKLTEDDLK